MSLNIIGLKSPIFMPILYIYYSSIMSSNIIGLKSPIFMPILYTTDVEVLTVLVLFEKLTL